MNGNLSNLNFRALIGRGLPFGGTAGQVLTKVNAADANAVWADSAAAQSPTTWPFAEVVFNNAYQGIGIGAFTTVTFNSTVADTHSAFSNVTNFYTIPQAGVYDILFKFRISDSDRTGASYGVGVDTSNTDSPAFSWYVGAPMRQGALYRRISTFAAGDQLRAFYYCEFSGQLNFASLAILRVR